MSIDLSNLGRCMYFTFGRFQPPTKGHGESFDAIAKAAGSHDYRIYISQTHDKKGDNPLPPDEKLKYLKKMFPAHRDKFFSGPRDPKACLQDINMLVYEKAGVKSSYDHVVFLVGSDRVGAMQWIKKYNDIDYSFLSIEIKSTGSRDPDGVTFKISGTNQRKYAALNQVNLFRKGIPSNINSKDAESLMKMVRENLPKGYGL